jgi:type IV secretory pathway VirB2 component (pilin)
VSEDKFKAKPVYLVPILGSLMVGLAFAYLLLNVPAPVYPVTPFPDTPSGGFSNAIYFVIIIAVGATIFYFLLKWRSKKMIVILTTFALTAASVLLSAYYLFLLLSSYPNWEIYVTILTIIITVLFDIAIFKIGGKVANIAVVILGGALGVFLGNSIPVWSAMLILVFLAVYDIIAVYKGPVGKIAESGLDQLKGLSYAFKDIQMGLGDLVFYSMLCAVMLLNPDFGGWLPYLLSLFGILGGSYLTFKILEKKSIFPGLPVPIFLGLSLGLLGSLLPIF